MLVLVLFSVRSYELKVIILNKNKGILSACLFIGLFIVLKIIIIPAKPLLKDTHILPGEISSL